MASEAVVPAAAAAETVEEVAVSPVAEQEAAPSAGGVAGALAAFKESALVKQARDWALWSFKRSGTVTWIVMTTGIVVLFPLVINIQREDMLVAAEAQHVQQLQQQGYSQAQIQQMMGAPPPPSPQAAQPQQQ